ncbi:DUF928 domain-containing protein [Pleurocapsa sp. PCC 7319]|uniref:DUF928 domain-containing protein n=1 Tax=Pleurocapsa sp. PCC 7319 TaxID=118161 RepID=UPI0003468C51|nr:DUF928 domain-containing protein [Pleurocapsa sp. PCC 7319]
MFLKTIYSQRQRQNNQWIIGYLKAWQLIFILLVITFCAAPQSAQGKEKKNTSNRLPPAPKTGSPEGDFSAGGTRGNKPWNFVCGDKTQNISYLLGDRNREFTAAAYPSFWFHIPNNIDRTTEIKFVVSELKTGKKVYERVIQGTNKSGILGITLPQEKQYALSSEANYSWSLSVDCAGPYRGSETILAGWITRLSSDSKLEKQLAAASKPERSEVYLENNFLYDALTELAQGRMAQPNNTQIERAWNQLLIKLGWQDLAHQKSSIEPCILDLQISSNQK